jgi:hypothetical protein
MNPGDICDVCKRQYYREEYRDYTAEGCSEFCATVYGENLAALATLKPGDFGLWPCSECGCVIEDKYTPGGWCSGCSPKVMIRKLEGALREALETLRRIADRAPPGSVADSESERAIAKIEATLAGKEPPCG